MTRHLARIALNSVYRLIGLACGSDRTLVGVNFYRSHLKKSDTLFVLASGASIGRFSDHDFEIVAQHDSIALNSFIVHEFRPTYWLLETHPPKLGLLEYADGEGGKLPALQVLYKGYNSPRKFRHVIANLRRLRMAGPGRLLLLKDAYARDLGSASTLTDALREKRDDRFYNYLGSVTYCLGLAYKVGYKRVVLCGVDCSQRYFFHENPRYQPARGAPPFLHASNILADNQPVMDEILRTVAEMNALFENTLGGGVYQLNCDGPLASLLGSYPPAL